MNPALRFSFSFFSLFLKSGQLAIESPTVKDGGSYVCVAESGTLRIESEAVIVMVTEGCEDDTSACSNNSRYWSLIPRLFFM